MFTPCGTIFDIKKFSIHDGPGIRTTIFLKGCPLHCAWCHNPEGISPLKEIQFWNKRCISCHECVLACENQAIKILDGKLFRDPELCQGCGSCAEICPAEATEIIGQTMSVSDVLREIEKDVLYYDQSGGGVTFSGGEPLLQITFLEAILRACKDHGIHTTVDTSGFVKYQNFQRLNPLTDLYLFDIKIIDNDRHLNFTGVPNQLILENLTKLSKSGVEIIVRIPIIPGVNDDDENIDKIGEYIISLDRNHLVNILPYHCAAADKYERMNHKYTLQEVRPPTAEHMSQIAEHLESFGLSVTIGG
jgi:pyruvate formate lyase activating enzyme